MHVKPGSLGKEGSEIAIIAPHDLKLGKVIRVDSGAHLTSTGERQETHVTGDGSRTRNHQEGGNTWPKLESPNEVHRGLLLTGLLAELESFQSPAVPALCWGVAYLELREQPVLHSDPWWQ